MHNTTMASCITAVTMHVHCGMDALQCPCHVHTLVKLRGKSLIVQDDHLVACEAIDAERDVPVVLALEEDGDALRFKGGLAHLLEWFHLDGNAIQRQ